MIYPVDEYRLVYGSVPKAACTSLKQAMYQLKFGRPFERILRDGKSVGIHRAGVLGARPVAELPDYADYFKFAVVRDPVSRVLSTWSNKVMDEGWLQRRHTYETNIRRRLHRLVHRQRRRKPLDPRPDINHFAIHIADYAKRYWTVRHHTDPVAHFLGADLSAYDRIYRMDELSVLEEDLRKHTGLPEFKIPRANESSKGTKASVDDLTDEALEVLVDWLKPEYELLSAWFQPPTRNTMNTSKTGAF